MQTSYWTAVPAIMREYKAEEPVKVVKRYATVKSEHELFIEFLEKGIALLDKADKNLLGKYPHLFKHEQFQQSQP